MKKGFKRVFASFCVITLLSGSIYTGNVQKAEASTTTNQKENIVTAYSNATPGIEPTVAPEGYAFAGWYKDETCRSPLTEAGSGYAKFVDAEVFGIKAQILASTTSDTDTTSIRFVTSVDSLKYKNIGFVITINNRAKTIFTDTVYKTLYAVGQSSGKGEDYTPADLFSPKSIRFMTYTLDGIPNLSFGTMITVRTCWTTQDGTVVYGKQVKKNVNMGIFGDSVVDSSMIEDCDTTDYLANSGGSVDVIAPNCKEGTGAFASSGSGSLWWQMQLGTPVDISEYQDGNLAFSLYMDDTENITNPTSDLQIELGNGKPEELEADTSAKLVLHNCDEKTFAGADTLTTDEGECKDGGAAKIIGTANNRFQYTQTSAGKTAWNLLDYQNGTLHLWFFVDVKDNLPTNNLQVLLTSSGSNFDTSGEYVCRFDYPKTNLSDGWNELFIDVTNPAHAGKSFTWSSVNGIKVAVGSNNGPSLKTIVDDIYITSDTGMWYETDKLVSGWNDIVIPMNQLRDIDFSSISYLRMYHSLLKDEEVILDNVRVISADGTTTQTLFSCDNTEEVAVTTDGGRNFWVESIYSNLGTRYKEGAGALELECSEGSTTLFEFNREDEKADIKEWSDGQLHFWFYVNDTSHLNGGNIRVELSSNGTSQDEMLVWTISSLSNGWNDINLAFSDAYDTFLKNEIDYEEINYVRIALEGATSTSELLVRLDDVRAVAAGMILDCDDMEFLNSSDGTAKVTVDEYKEGSGAIQCTVSDNLWYEFVRTTSVNLTKYESGRLHFGLYINSVDNLSDNQIIVKLGSGATAEAENLEWHIAKSELVNGWNEVRLPMAAADLKAGSIDLSSVDYFQVSQEGCSTNLVTIIDGVCARENEAQIIDTLYHTDDVVIADIIPTEMGYEVDANGVEDSTSGIQEALNDCYIQGGGTVYLPAGTYKITDSISIPSYVTLRGDWQDPDSENFDGNYGTIIRVEMEAATDVHSVSASGVFELNGTAGALGLTVYYPNQSVDDVKIYPYTFYYNGYMLATVRNVTVINGYRGIGATTEYPTTDEEGNQIESTSHESLQIDNFKGTFLDCGIELYHSSDVGTVNDVVISNQYWHKWNQYASGTSVTGLDVYTRANTKGMKLGDVEWTQYTDIEIDGCKVGVQTVEGRRVDSTVQFVGSFYDLSITNCNIGFLADYLDTRWGMTIAKSSISGSESGIVNNTAAFIKLCDVDVVGDIMETTSDTVVIDPTDLSSHEINYRDSYTKPADNLLIANLQQVSVILNNCDETFTGAVTGVTTDAGQFKEGTGAALKADNLSNRFQYEPKWFGETAWNFTNYQDGTLHLWLYISNTDLLPKKIIRVSLGTDSAGAFDNICYWDIPASKLTNGGWTELFIDMSTPTYKADNVDWSSMNGIKVHLGNANINNTDETLTTIVDDIYVTQGQTEKDVTEKLQKYLYKMEKLGGGVVYVPGGTYSLYSPLVVPAGVELRGSASVATRDQIKDCAGTLFLCYYGDEGGGITKPAFITLAGENAGLNGVRIIYANNGPIKTDDNTTIETTYAIRGKASGVYVVNSMISAAAYGVDFRNCDNHYIEGVTTCCYYNTYYLGGTGGTITNCLQNGTVLLRTAAPVSLKTWPGGTEQEMREQLFYPILKKYCHYIILDGAENESLYNIFAYGVMTMITNQNSTNTSVINMATDKVGGSSVQIVMDGGSLFGVNILRCDTRTYEVTNKTTSDGTKLDGTYLMEGIASKAYKYIEGDLELHNRLVINPGAGTTDYKNYIVSNEPAITPDNAASVWLFTCDSTKNHSTGDGLSVTNGVTNGVSHGVKQGTGAYVTSGKAKDRILARTNIKADASIYKDGKLHLWFYVNDTSYLYSSSALYIECGTENANTMKWTIALSDLQNGWNELSIPIKDAEGYTNVDFSSINYLYIYQDAMFDFIVTMGQNDKLITVVDDVRIIPSDETESNQKMLFTCDTEDADLNITTSGTFEVTNVSGEYTEGTGAFKTSGNAAERIKMFLDTPINIASYEDGKLCLDLYINDKDCFTYTDALRVEIGSSRRTDCEELQWKISLDNLQDGWNTIELNLSEGTRIKDEIIHLGTIDYFRIYHTGATDELITILDNVYVTHE